MDAGHCCEKGLKRVKSLCDVLSFNTSVSQVPIKCWD